MKLVSYYLSNLPYKLIPFDVLQLAKFDDP